MQELWAMILKNLAEQLSPTSVETWFSECKIVSAEASTFVLYVENEFKKTIIEQRFIPNIKSALDTLFAAEFDVRIISDEEKYQKYTVREGFGKNASLPQTEEYTFQKFVVGKSNIFAYSAAKHAAEHSGSVYNPLFLYGASGLGKTHLLLAIGQHMRDNGLAQNIVYIKGDDFVNKMVHAIKNHTTEQFREEFRNADLLLVDDVHLMAHMAATQEEFFCTFNAVYEAGHQIVITSDLPPRELTILDERLRTRFEGGLIADIQPPDKDTRKKIILRKSEDLGLQLSAADIELISEHLTNNIRQIEGFLKTLSACRSISGTSVSPDELLSSGRSFSRTSKLTPEAIILETARCFSVSEKDLRGISRSAKNAMARQAAMYLLRTELMMTFSDIGSEFGNRNHSSVMSAVRKAESLISSDSLFADAVQGISQNLRGK